MLKVKVKAVTDQNSMVYCLSNRVLGRTVSYGLSFFPLRFMAQARSVRAINRGAKNEDQ